MHFLDCARAYRSIPDTDELRQSAQLNAQSCYVNAMHAFANAGRLASAGQAALAQAAREDPRLASLIQNMLAKPPHDCLAE